MHHADRDVFSSRCCRRSACVQAAWLRVPFTAVQSSGPSGEAPRHPNPPPQPTTPTHDLIHHLTHHLNLPRPRLTWLMMTSPCTTMKRSTVSTLTHNPNPQTLHPPPGSPG